MLPSRRVAHQSHIEKLEGILRVVVGKTTKDAKAMARLQRDIRELGSSYFSFKKSRIMQIREDTVNPLQSNVPAMIRKAEDLLQLLLHEREVLPADIDVVENLGKNDTQEYSNLQTARGQLMKIKAGLDELRKKPQDAQTSALIRKAQDFAVRVQRQISTGQGILKKVHTIEKTINAGFQKLLKETEAQIRIIQEMLARLLFIQGETDNPSHYFAQLKRNAEAFLASVARQQGEIKGGLFRKALSNCTEKISNHGQFITAAITQAIIGTGDLKREEERLSHLLRELGE